MAAVIPVISSGLVTIAIRAIDGPWPQTICGILGVSMLLLASLVERMKDASVDMSTLRQCGLMFLAGTPSYTRVLDVAHVMAIALATAGRAEFTPPFLALYYGSSLRHTSDAAFTIRFALAVIFACGLRNPIVK